MVTWREGHYLHPIGDALLLLTDKSAGVGFSFWRLTAGVGLILQYTEADFFNPLNRPMP